jgi:hypothetical protein
MPRSTNTQKTKRINAAYEMLAHKADVPEVAVSLSRRFKISLRQAYRYVETAQTLKEPLPIAESTIPVTFKLSVGSVNFLRAQSKSEGTTIGAIVKRLIAWFMNQERQRNG